MGCVTWVSNTHSPELVRCSFPQWRGKGAHSLLSPSVCHLRTLASCPPSLSAGQGRAPVRLVRVRSHRVRFCLCPVPCGFAEVPPGRRVGGAPFPAMVLVVTPRLVPVQGFPPWAGYPSLSPPLSCAGPSKAPTSIVHGRSQRLTTRMELSRAILAFCYRKKIQPCVPASALTTHHGKSARKCQQHKQMCQKLVTIK